MALLKRKTAQGDEGGEWHGGMSTMRGVSCAPALEIGLHRGRAMPVLGLILRESRSITGEPMLTVEALKNLPIEQLEKLIADAIKVRADKLVAYPENPPDQSQATHGPPVHFHARPGIVIIRIRHNGAGWLDFNFPVETLLDLLTGLTVTTKTVFDIKQGKLSGNDKNIPPILVPGSGRLQ